MKWYEELFDETYLRTYDPLLSPEYTIAQVDGIESLLDLSPPADILDMPCGQGRHSIELARRGYRVTGVDLSRYLLDVARRRALEARVPLVDEVGAGSAPPPGGTPSAVTGPAPGGPGAARVAEAGGAVFGQLELVASDMRDFSRPDAYDVAINIFTSFGYLENEDEDRKALEAFFESLRPGGRLLMEMVHKYWLLRSGQPHLWVETEGAFTLERIRFDVLTDRMETDRVIICDGEVHRRHFSIRHYSFVELCAMARSVGFQLVGAWGSLDGEEPLAVDSRRLVVVFRKP